LADTEASSAAGAREVETPTKETSPAKPEKSNANEENLAREAGEVETPKAARERVIGPVRN